MLIFMLHLDIMGYYGDVSLVNSMISKPWLIGH